MGNTNSALAVQNYGEEEKIIAVDFPLAIKREKARRKKPTLNLMVGELYYSSYNKNFDKTNAVAEISDLFYKRGYSFEKRIDKIEELIAKNKSTFTEQETKYIQEALSLANDDIRKRAGTKKEIRNYSAVQDKINKLRSNLGRKKHISVAFPDDSAYNYSPLEVKVSESKDNPHYVFVEKKSLSPPITIKDLFERDFIRPALGSVLIRGYFPRIIKKSLAYAAALALFFGASQGRDIKKDIKDTKEAKTYYQVPENL